MLKNVVLQKKNVFSLSFILLLIQLSSSKYPFSVQHTDVMTKTPKAEVQILHRGPNNEPRSGIMGQ